VAGYKREKGRGNKKFYKSVKGRVGSSFTELEGLKKGEYLKGGGGKKKWGEKYVGIGGRGGKSQRRSGAFKNRGHRS